MSKADEMTHEQFLDLFGNVRISDTKKIQAYYGQIIDKLQKENQELKDTDLTSVYMKGFYDSKSKWEEKVKNKIKELDETKQYWTEDVIDILDELLKE